MAHTAWQGGRRIEEAQGKTGKAKGDQGWTRKEIGSTKEGINNFRFANYFKLVKNCKIYLSKRFHNYLGISYLHSNYGQWSWTTMITCKNFILIPNSIFQPIWAKLSSSIIEKMATKNWNREFGIWNSWKHVVKW